MGGRREQNQVARGKVVLGTERIGGRMFFSVFAR